MKRQWIVGLPLAALLVMPAAAHGEWTHWQYQCMPGAFQACASISVGLAYDPGQQRTAVSLTMANLQGAHAWLPDPGPYGLMGVSLSNIVGDRDGYDGSNEQWLQDSAKPIGSAGGFSSYSAVTNWLSGVLYLGGESGSEGQTFGCDGPTDGFAPGLAWTCRGAWAITFDVPGRWEFTDQTQAEIRFGHGNFGGSPGSCVVGVDCVTVVPEPSTWILLATGLLGLGVVARRRKSDSCTP